jgi:5-methylthioadenosine/S-adenosylhomocysteine deaminase
VEAEVVRRRGLRGVLSFEATERVSAENGELGLQENAYFIDSCRERGGLVPGLMCLHTTFTAPVISFAAPLRWPPSVRLK